MNCHRFAHAALAVIYLMTAIVLAMKASPALHAASALAAALIYATLRNGPRE